MSVLDFCQYTTSRKDNACENFVKIKFWGNKFIITYCFLLINLKKNLSLSLSLSLSLCVNSHPLSEFSHHSQILSLSHKPQKKILYLSLLVFSHSLEFSLSLSLRILSHSLKFSLSQTKKFSHSFTKGQLLTHKEITSQTNTEIEVVPLPEWEYNIINFEGEPSR